MVSLFSSAVLNLFAHEAIRYWWSFFLFFENISFFLKKLLILILSPVFEFNLLPALLAN